MSEPFLRAYDEEYVAEVSKLGWGGQQPTGLNRYKTLAKR